MAFGDNNRHEEAIARLPDLTRTTCTYTVPVAHMLSELGIPVPRKLGSTGKVDRSIAISEDGETMTVTITTEAGR